MDTKRGARFIDRTGHRIGYLTMTNLSDKPYVDNTGRQTLLWNWICDCGNVGTSTWANLFRENKKFKSSCGCNKGGMRDSLLLRNQGLKKCSSCNEVLPLNDFSNNKSATDGLQSTCKKCKSIRDKNYRENPAQGRDNLLKKKSDYYFKIKIEFPEIYEEKLARSREIRDYSKEYQRVQSDEYMKAKDSVRKLFMAALRVRNINKSKLVLKTQYMLGCDFQFFKQYIENQFQEGMNWLNHGTWHIDHKVPLNVGNSVDEIIKLNHYTNLQPLWANENLLKSYKMLPEHYELHSKLLGRNYIE
jgi:hypothetical protein